MKKFVVLCAIALISKLSANCDLVDSYTVAAEYNTLLERECSSLFGGGGVYYGKIVEASESFPVSCDGIKRSYGYVVIYGCNTCTSKNVQERLKQDTIACTEQCRMTMNKCVYNGISNDWGGYYNTDQHPSCSPLKSTSLPGCSESSSSQNEESSSSEKLSSASEESSNSEEESYSSESDEDSSSSEEEIASSSSENDGESSSSEDDCDDPDGCDIDRTGLECFNKYVNQDGTKTQCYAKGFIAYDVRPRMVGSIEIYEAVCDSFGLHVDANIPIIKFNSVSTSCYNSSCDYKKSYEGYWSCPLENYYLNESSVEGCHTTNDWSHFYFTLSAYDPTASDPFFGNVDFSSENKKFLYPVFDIEEFYSAIMDKGVKVFNTNSFRLDYMTDMYPELRVESINDYIRACIEHFAPDIPVSESSSSNDSSSSSSSEYSSSSQMSSSSESMNSSSSLEYSSSVEEMSSSSISSSSEGNIESNSSGEVNGEPFVAGAEQEYSPDQIFSEGLLNMEKGKCYSLNPERGAQIGWVNNDAQDSFWWQEVNCESGKKIDKNRIGACPGFPLSKVPNNPQNACFAYDGKCYRCKSENSYVDCSQEWLWKWNFNEQNVGSWYEEVDCNQPQVIKRRPLTIALQ